MAESTIVTAEPSTAPVVDITRGPLVDMTGDQRAEFRRTGELPEPPKKQEEAATSAETKVETGEATAPKKPQETRRKPDAEHRIGELTAETKRLKAELEAMRTPKPAEAVKSAPVQQPAPQQTRTKPTAEDKGQDGKPKYETYEDFVEDLADWKAEQRWSNQQREAQQKEQGRALQAKVEEARGRYEKFDEVLTPTLNAIVGDQQVSPAVKAMLNDSEVLPDLIFTLGSNAKELAAFVKMAKENSGKALRYVALTESLIAEELEAKKAPAPKTETPPVKTQTSAPKPPAEVGGRNAAPPDGEQAAAQAGDFRRFKAEANRKAIARMRA